MWKSRIQEGFVINTRFIRNICFQYKWQTETCTIIFFHFCSVIYKKVFQNMKSGDFFHISSTFIIKNNRKTQSTHTYRRTESRTETEREEELLLVMSFLTSFRRSRTKTLTGRSHASWRTALQTNKEERTGSWGWNDRAEVSETDKERDIQKLRDIIWNMSQSHYDWPSHTHHRTKSALIKLSCHQSEKSYPSTGQMRAFRSLLKIFSRATIA